MAQVVAYLSTEKIAGGPGQTGTLDFSGQCPARGAVGCDELRLSSPPHRHGDGDHRADEPAACCYSAAAHEDVGCVSIEEVPPFEQSPWVIDRNVEETEPRRTEA